MVFCEDYSVRALSLCAGRAPYQGATPGRQRFLELHSLPTFVSRLNLKGTSLRLSPLSRDEGGKSTLAGNVRFSGSRNRW